MARWFMRVVGIVLVVVGVVGFFEPLRGIFNLTPAHDLVHLVTGAIAVVVSRSTPQSVWYARVFGVVYLLVAAAGLVTSNLFGLIPLMPADTILHFLLAVGALWIGFVGARHEMPTAVAAH